MLVMLLMLLNAGSSWRVRLRVMAKFLASTPLTSSPVITTSPLSPWLIWNSLLTRSWAMLDSLFFGLKLVSLYTMTFCTCRRAGILAPRATSQRMNMALLWCITVWDSLAKNISGPISMYEREKDHRSNYDNILL